MQSMFSDNLTLYNTKLWKNSHSLNSNKYFVYSDKIHELPAGKNSIEFKTSM